MKACAGGGEVKTPVDKNEDIRRGGEVKTPVTHPRLVQKVAGGIKTLAG